MRPSGPMQHLTTRQGGACLLRRGVGQSVGIAERHDPLILHHQEIENRDLEVGIASASAHIVQTRPGCAEKLLELLFVRRKPAERLQGEDLGGFLLIFHGVFHHISLPKVRI